MTDSGLINKTTTLTVTDPWDFYSENGSGPFSGTVVAVAGEAALVELAYPLEFQRTTFSQVVVRPRVVGYNLLNALGASLAVNLVPVSDKVVLQSAMVEKYGYLPGSPFHAAASWRGWFLIGEMKIV